MTPDDRDYYYRRAEAQLGMAQASHIPQAVRAHYILAGHYLDRAYHVETIEITETAAAGQAVRKGER